MHEPFNHFSRVITGLLVTLVVVALGTVQTGAAQTGPDMAITITGPRTVRIGKNITYTITATNVGDETATGVTLEAWAPDWFNPVSVECFGATPLDISACSYPPVQSGATVTMTATLQAGVPFTFEHPFELAWVSADLDVNSQNDEASIKVNFAGSRAQ
jgi:uncharacterized repeat protein (TIGR01451 family)